ncbi:hypothetical protein V6N13_088663 [Hibiscus sabdariffa]
MDHQAGSRESVNGEQGEEYRRVDGMEDVLKREVLTTCAVAWCKGSLHGTGLLATLKREGFTGTFRNIAQVWGSLIRVEDPTAEPQSFERARFLIETPCVDRIEETLKLFWGEESYRIRIQEVEVVHSHDLMCNCEDSDTVVSSEDNQREFDKLQSVRDNPTFAPVMLPSHVDVGGDVNCDEWLGLVERNIALNSDHMDVMWESQPELEPPEWNSVKIRGETVLTKMEQLRGVPIAENQEQLLELDWNTQSGKDMEFSVSKSNLREESVHFTTALNSSDFDLVPVPVSIVSTSVIPEVHVVVTNSVAPKGAEAMETTRGVYGD